MSALVVSGLTAEQHAIRAQGVGASEVHDALFNPAALWLKKTGRDPSDDSALGRLGNAIEPYIIGEYELATGAQVHRKPPTLRNGRQIAHLDGLALSDDGPVAVECKWRGHREGWGEAGSADIPRTVLLQVQQQMHLAHAVVAHVPVLFMRPPIVVYEVPFDEELAEMLRAGVNRFWRYVETDTPPDISPDAPEASELLRKIYPGTNGERIQATRMLEHWRATFHDAADLAAEYKKSADTAKAHMLRAMGLAAELEFSDGMIFRRKVVKVKGYTVEPREQVDARFTKPKEHSNAE